MKLKENQYQKIEKLLPRQRGNVKVENRNLLNALIYRCQNGCSWRGLPPSFGPWHTVYVRIDRWAKSRVLERVYTALAAEGSKDIQAYALDSTSVKVHPDAHGAGKNGRQTVGKSRGGWNTKIHAVTASDTQVVGFLLSGGNAADAQAGQLLLETLGRQEDTVNLLMDRAYQDDKTRLTAWGLKFNPVVPPKRNRVKPWEYDRELYKRRNEVERFFRRLKAYRGIGTRYDKRDIMFSAFIWLACICIFFRSVNTP